MHRSPETEGRQLRESTADGEPDLENRWSLRDQRCWERWNGCKKELLKDVSGGINVPGGFVMVLRFH